VFRVTAAGVASLGNYEPLPEGSGLRDYWLRQLGAGVPQKIFSVLVERYPNGVNRSEIGELAGVSTGSSTFRNALTRLKNLQVMEAHGNAFRMSQELS
jgi:hypothetical protein